jgi:hypothetical protein
MAKTKEFTIEVENRPGAVAEIAKTLGTAKVNILALLATAHGATGTVQLVVENGSQAKKAFDKAAIKYREIPAEQHELANKPGALAEYLEKLAAKGVNLDSICCTAPKGGKKAVLVCTTAAAADEAKAVA